MSKRIFLLGFAGGIVAAVFLRPFAMDLMDNLPAHSYECQVLIQNRLDRPLLVVAASDRFQRKLATPVRVEAQENKKYLFFRGECEDTKAFPSGPHVVISAFDFATKDHLTTQALVGWENGNAGELIVDPGQRSNE